LTDSEWDVLVLGAGPAGSASAALLAEQGHRVLVLEKQQFPRFQIGESLLPVSLTVLERLGVGPREDSHVFKRGAQFVSEATDDCRVFDFSRALDGSPRHAWQVDRSRFDAALRDRAVQLGAEVRHGVSVARVECGQERVAVHTDTGDFSARYVVDATGQGRLLARQMGSAEPYPGFGHAAAFAHFDGVSQEVFDEIGPEHDIRIMIVPQGWGWVIPLPRRRLSIGLVTRRRGIAEDLEQYMAESPLIQRWIRGATRVDGRAVRNFSYKNQRPHGGRYVCVGDAACFLDPVFSSGVSLALVGASRMTDILSAALNRGQEHDAELMQPLADYMQRGYDAFAGIIDRFYHTHFIKHFIFGSLREERTEREIVSVLAGDVWRDDNGFQQSLVSSRRRGGSRPPSSLSQPSEQTEGEAPH